MADLIPIKASELPENTDEGKGEVIVAIGDVLHTTPLEYFTSGFVGNIDLTDTPSKGGMYIPTETGTYANAGGLIYDPQGDDKGFLVQFIKNGSEWSKNAIELPVLANGTYRTGENSAVSGDTSFKHTSSLDINRLKQIEGPISRLIARSYTPLAFREKGIKIRYAQIYGYAEEVLVSDTFSTSNNVWERDTDSRFILKEGNIIEHINRKFLKRTDLSISSFIRLDNITVENIFVFSGETVICSVFDKNLLNLGVVNRSGVASGQVSSLDISKADILTDYPKATYLMFNFPSNKGFNAYLTADGGLVGTLKVDFNELNRNTQDYFDMKGLFRSMTSGSVNKSPAYKHSRTLIIKDRSNLIITGYSGASNQVALAVFFDIDLNFVGYYKSATSGQVINHKIPETAIPTSAFYIVGNATISQIASIYGVELSLLPKESEVLMDSKIESSRKRLIARELHINSSDIYVEGFYLNKLNGKQNQSAGYKHSIPLRLKDRSGIIINGYSGISNQAGLILWFDKDMVFIDFYNSTTNGTVYNHAVPEEEIPTNAIYGVINTTIGQATRNDGFDFEYSVRKYYDLIKAMTKSTEVVIDLDIPRVKQASHRSGIANPNSDGFIKLNNYFGNPQNIHPKVLYFENGWNGFKYWMGYTPYPYGVTSRENPCLAVSQDGMNWEDPPSVNNPLAQPPTDGYNSDTHLVYRSDTDTLEIWWRPYNTDTGKDQIVRRTSADGINWTPMELIFDFSDPMMLSPAIIFEDNKYKIWYPSGGKIMYLESSNNLATAWSSRTEVAMNWGTNYPWHMDVQRTNLGLEFVIQAWEEGGGNNTCDIFYALIKEPSDVPTPRKIIMRGDEPVRKDYRGLYRACLIKVEDVYSVYYSGISADWYRPMYLTKSRDIDRLRGVNL